ncbi:MAG: glycosyltransferase family 2 protein [Acidobacteria bacterium]|nr:glycosyltransferase family 2 protein [Acidobacteriota bacterium]
MSDLTPRESDTSSDAELELSVVVLAFAAGESLRGFVATVVEALAELDVPWEIVLVANYWPASGDATPAVSRALAAADPRIEVVAAPKRGGMGWDMRSGFDVARGRYVAVIDGDGQMPGRDVVRVFRAVREGAAGLGKTYRTRRHDGALREVLSAGYNALFRLLFPGLRARDVNAKPKVLRRELLARMALESDDWFVDAEILIAARRFGLGIVELPTEFGRLEARPSFVRPGAVLEFLWNLARHRVREWRRPAAGRETATRP